MDLAEYIAVNASQEEAEHDPFTAERYRHFERWMIHGTRRVLDVGCSNGAGGCVLRQRRPEIILTALDCVVDRLARLPDAVYDGSLGAFSASLPIRDRSFDAIVAGEFIEHVTYADVIPTLGEFYRILRPGGRLLMTTPNPDSIRYRLGRAKMLGGAHVSAHYPKQLAAMMAEVGFGPATWRGTGKSSRLIGTRFPVLDAYGSYLIWAERP